VLHHGVELFLDLVQLPEIIEAPRLGEFFLRRVQRRIRDVAQRHDVFGFPDIGQV
jgi:hypothetical protein